MKLVKSLKDMDTFDLYTELTQNEKKEWWREYCYKVELELLRRIDSKSELDKIIQALNIIEGRIGYEKKLIAEIKKYNEYPEDNLLQLLDYLEYIFEEEMEKLAHKRVEQENLNLSWDTNEARALIEKKVADVIASATWTESDLMPLERMDVVDGSRIGQIMKDLWYNE